VNLDWKRFSILMYSEIDFRIRATPEVQEHENNVWTEVHRAYKWSEAITVYRKMVDGNWDFDR